MSAILPAEDGTYPCCRHCPEFGGTRARHTKPCVECEEELSRGPTPEEIDEWEDHRIEQAALEGEARAQDEDMDKAYREDIENRAHDEDARSSGPEGDPGE